MADLHGALALIQEQRGRCTWRATDRQSLFPSHRRPGFEILAKDGFFDLSIDGWRKAGNRFERFGHSREASMVRQSGPQFGDLVRIALGKVVLFERVLADVVELQRLLGPSVVGGPFLNQLPDPQP